MASYHPECSQTNHLSSLLVSETTSTTSILSSAIHHPHLLLHRCWGHRGTFASAPSTPSSLSTPRGLIPYAYDPGVDSLLPDDQEDILHDPKASEADEKKLFAPGGLLYHNGSGSGGGNNWSWRGVWNTGMLSILILALLMLFLGYPVVTEFRTRSRKEMIDGNVRVNATGQVPVLFGVRELVDVDTPDDVKTRTGFDGQVYDLVFSDEFERPGRTFSWRRPLFRS
ncbi:hypothetical protein MPER_11431, partial [Moniliophthora perniciosa FA553]